MNKNGTIEDCEIKKKLVDYSGGEAMIHVLMEADIDMDGVISYEEFMLALTDANFFINCEYNIAKAFRAFDKDGDGQLGFEEFKELIDIRDDLND